MTHDPRRAAALVAVGLVVPGAEDPDRLWKNVLESRTFFRPAEPGDFGAEPSLFYQPGEPAPDKAYSLSGAWRQGRMEDFGDLRLPASFSPEAADVSLLWWLQAARKALEGANLEGHDPAEIGVIAGHVILPTRAMAEAAVSFYGREATRSWELNPFAPPPTVNHFRAVGYSAKLVAETFGFTGQAFTVDAACASSLYALRLALDRLRDGDLTAVVSGGLAQADPLFTQLGFSQLRALSKSGLSRPFSKEADGLVVGSGAVSLLLKRLDRAMEDGDEIICVISGVGLSNDRVGNLLAPEADGQERAMREAFLDAGVSPQSAPDLFEAHGTSTPLGDATEISAIKRLLSGRKVSRPPVVGSIKGNLGHLLSAAGAVSLVKAAWALKTKTLPPTAGFSSPSPMLELEKEPALRVLTSPEPWPEPPKGEARMAAVNAFGFGGVNAQAVLEEFRADLFSLSSSPASLSSASLGSASLGSASLGPAPSSSERHGASPQAPLSSEASVSPKKSPAKAKTSAKTVKAAAKAAQEASTDKDSQEKDSSDSAEAGSASERSAAKTASSQSSASSQSASSGGAPFAGGGPGKGRGPLTATLVAARTVLAPWISYDALLRYWLTPEEPPLAQTRRMGGLKATGFFFEQPLSLDVRKFHLPPRELAESLPQQTLALKPALAALNAMGLDPDRWPEEIDRDRVGVFMGVDIDPRAADFALRWLAPPRAAAALIRKGLISPRSEAELTRLMREGSPPPLTHNRVLGSLGSLVASRLARYLGTGGPSFTISEEKDSGLRALRVAMGFLASGKIDLALVGVVDTFGDPKTAALAPKTVWVEGAAAMLLASPKAAAILQPLAELTLTGSSASPGPLSGLFNLNRNAFYLRHHLKPLGRGHGFSYWLKNPDSPPRSLEGPGYAIVETPGARPKPLTVPIDPVRPDVWFFVNSENPEHLKENLSLLQSLLDSSQGRDLHQISREFWNRTFERGSPSLALLARDAREMSGHIRRVLAGETDKDLKPKILQAPAKPLAGETAWVFPGSGNHYKGLGRGLAATFPEVMFELENQSADPVELFQSDLLWEPNHKRPTVREAILGQVCFGLIGAKLLNKIAIKPQAVLGYSLGEVAALVATGLWPDRDQLWRDLLSSSLFNSDLAGELSAPRAFWNWPAHKPLKWTSAMVPRPEAMVRQAIEQLAAPHRHRVFILLVNTREEVVAGGEEASVQALAQALETPIFPIEDVAAVHAPVVSPVAESYRSFHSRRVAPDESLRFYSCYHAKAIEQETGAIAESLTAQALYGHVFPDLVEKAYEDGVRYFIEVGPGNSATRMIKSILGDKPHMAQSLAATAVDEGWTGLYRVIAELWLSGYRLVPDRLMLQPSPDPDPRYEIPIVLAPHPICWPDPAEALRTAGAAPPPPMEAKEAPGGPEAQPADYLSWLAQQTGETALGGRSDEAGSLAAAPVGPGRAQDAKGGPQSAKRGPETAGFEEARRGAETEAAIAEGQRAAGTRRRRAIQADPKAAPALGSSQISLGPGELGARPASGGQGVFEDSGQGEAFGISGEFSDQASENIGQYPFGAFSFSQETHPGSAGAQLGASGPGASNLGSLEQRGPGPKGARAGGARAGGARAGGAREGGAREGGYGDSASFLSDRSAAGLGGAEQGASGFSGSFDPGQTPAVVSLDRTKCLEFARGSVGLALGPIFSEIDKLPSRVRLPDEPMMFVDKVTKLEGKPLSLSSGRVVTEHEVKSGEWCLEEGSLTPGMSIESGQADLLLSAWLGIDLATEGLAQYRLLDAQVVFHRDPPVIGETAAYDIRLINFFSHADTRMFRFEFDGTVEGIPLLSMRRGCAGFFTQKALSEGKGLAKKEPEKSAPASVHPPLVSLLEDKTPTPPIFPRDLEAIRDGQLTIFGPAFEKLKLESPPLTLPSGNLALIDAIPNITWNGGAYGAGFVRAEAVIEPDAWFLTCHFPGDNVMPGTLMYDACLQTLRAYLLSLGWVGLKGQCAFAPVLGLAQSLRCRGQVTPATNMVAYEAHVKKIGLTPPSDFGPGGEPYAVADAIMWADGRPIVECLDLGLRLSGLTMEALQAQWTFKRSRGRPKGSLGAKKLQLLEQAAAPAKTETVVRRQVKKPEPAPAPGSVSVRRPAKAYEVFDKEMLTEMSTGVLSNVLGPAYARFDDGRFVARLPKAPYDFIDEAVIRKGRLGQVATGTQVEAFWKPSLGDRAWILDEAGGDPPRLPYAALNEIALQPCGFLAAYMGSALAFQGPMRFRNLGGEAYIRSLAEPLGAMIQTRATLTKASVLGSMTIQHYQFTCHHGGRPLYEGQTHFGFHNPESLDRQSGLKANPGLLKALTSAAAASGVPMDFPVGPAWPSKHLAMLDSVVIDDKGDGRAWGRAKVDPKAWFFGAHFPGDPVWPGSLGLEAFLQLAKVLAAKIFEPGTPLSELKASWRSPELDTVHRWLYRGQIVPRNNEVTLGIKVTNLDHLKKALTFKGLLWVDELVVYQVEEFTVAMAGPRVAAKAPL